MARCLVSGSTTPLVPLAAATLAGVATTGGRTAIWVAGAEPGLGPLAPLCRVDVVAEAGLAAGLTAPLVGAEVLRVERARGSTARGASTTTPVTASPASAGCTALTAAAACRAARFSGFPTRAIVDLHLGSALGSSWQTSTAFTVTRSSKKRPRTEISASD
jgi:hypothetical protein